MSDELTRLLTETLHSRGADVGPRSELTSRVLQKGRSARNRRLALGWGTIVAVAAAAVVAVGLWGPVGQQAPNPGPANSRMPSPSVTSPSTSSATVTEAPPEDALMAYAGKLPLGPPVGLVPRAEKRGTTIVVVTADRVVTLPADTVMAYDLTSSAEGLVVTTHAYGFTGGGPDPLQALYLIRTDGRLTRLHQGAFNGLAVDPTGKDYAIAEVSLGADDKVHITVASLAQRGQTHSRTEAVGTRLLGWTTRGLLLSGMSRTWLWQPGERSVTDLAGVTDASVMPTDQGRLLVATGQTVPDVCLHLFSVSNRRMGPVLTCSAGNGWTVSPDGRRVVVGSTVVDLTTGSVGPVLMNSLGFYFPHWEDSAHVLSQAMGADPQGQPLTPIWVRCDVTTGACEQAPIPRSNGATAVMDW
jgi:hypothetical protein